MVVKNDNNSIVIPQDATTQVQDKIFVYKVDGEGKVHYTEIKVNDQNDGKTYIVTSGLAQGRAHRDQGTGFAQRWHEDKARYRGSV